MTDMVQCLGAGQNLLVSLAKKKKKQTQKSIKTKLLPSHVGPKHWW